MDMVKKILKLLVSVGGLAFIFYKIPFGQVLGHWNMSMLPWVIATIVASTLTMVIQANRWKGLSIQGPTIPLKTYYAYTALGYFFNNLIPGGFGGDAVKSITFGKRFNQTSQSVSAVIIARIQGLLSLFIFFFGALPFVLVKYQVPIGYTLFMVGSSLLCLVLILFCLFSDKITIPQFILNRFSFISKMQESLSIYRSQKKQMFLSSLDSIWLQILTLFCSYAFFKAVGLNLDISIIIVFTSITTIVSMLPISLNGVGVREWVQISLFSGILGLEPAIVLSAGLLGYIPLLFQILQGVVVYIFISSKKSRE
ncbi:MAG: flippase-like domain-containing protein [Fibrobacteraceae bacterium]|nr:flippase-like domain-containing protein [Fibrobacteraceae bacterium]